MVTSVRDEQVARPEALVIPADPAFFRTSVCGTPLMLRTVYALGRVTGTVHVLRTAACSASAVQDLESEISDRELMPRVEWTDSADSVPTENGLFVVNRPGVFDSRLCAELSAEAVDDAAILRCRRPGEAESPLWFAGKEAARPLAKHLAAHPGEALSGAPDLAAMVRDYPPDGAVCEIVSDDRTRRLAEKKLFKRAGKSIDSPVAKLDRNISGLLTRYLVRTSITPNQVTIANAGVGLFGAALVLAGTYWAQVIGAALLVLTVILDGCDGEVARLKFLESDFGRKLDFFLDNVVNASAIFAAGAGYYLQSGDSLYRTLALYTAALAVAAVWPVYSLFFREKQTAAGVVKERPADAYTMAENLQGRDFVYLILALALIGKTHWFSLIASVGLTVFVGFMLVLWGKRQFGQAGGAAA